MNNLIKSMDDLWQLSYKPNPLEWNAACNIKSYGYDFYFQHRITLSSGKVIIPDFIIPSLNVVIETDGLIHFIDQDCWVSDKEKNNAYATLGYLVLRFTWKDITQNPYGVYLALEDIKKKKLN